MVCFGFADEVGLTPDSSPELTKRSWFGSLMTSERDETYVILVKDRPLSSVKGDLIHAFLSIADLSHSVLTPMSFRVEYRRPGGPSMFQRNVRFHADITSAAGPQDINSVGSPGVYCISFTLLRLCNCHEKKGAVYKSNCFALCTARIQGMAERQKHELGPLRRFKRICEHIQAQILGRRPNTSPRISRRSTNEMSDSSSCGSETLSPTLRVSDDLSVGARNAGQTSTALARCKSEGPVRPVRQPSALAPQDRVGGPGERVGEQRTQVELRRQQDSSMIWRGFVICVSLFLTSF
ncbi:hypothetical protein CEXT_565051 [Caerostris extrusa]|uniref:Uncharacterized protein n=1 Tax=Caerostris extrusa TaxID=172846 RepID=A0AAV4RMS4_CAEEX|nr:hypothetical protein CEXT_565051 [Caerostris extrusa]